MALCALTLSLFCLIQATFLLPRPPAPALAHALCRPTPLLASQPSNKTMTLCPMLLPFSAARHAPWHAARLLLAPFCPACPSYLPSFPALPMCLFLALPPSFCCCLLTSFLLCCCTPYQLPPVLLPFLNLLAGSSMPTGSGRAARMAAAAGRRDHGAGQSIDCFSLSPYYPAFSRLHISYLPSPSVTGHAGGVVYHAIKMRRIFRQTFKRRRRGRRDLLPISKTYRRRTSVSFPLPPIFSTTLPASMRSPARHSIPTFLGLPTYHGLHSPFAILTYHSHRQPSFASSSLLLCLFSGVYIVEDGTMAAGGLLLVQEN